MTRRPRATRVRRRPPGAGRRFFVALGALLAVMVGVPLLLVVCSQLGLDTLHPFPSIGSGDEIMAFFERDLTATEIAPIALRGLLVVGWVLWAAMAVSVVAAILDATGNGLRSSVPRFAMFAGLGRWIAAGLTALTSLGPNFVSAGSLASPRPFTVSSPTVASPSSTPAETAVQPGHARVQHGESIETFAQRTLGDATRWSEIWELNKNAPVGQEGEVWSVAWKLSAGWDLRLPVVDTFIGALEFSGTPTYDAAASSRLVSSHLVVAGDSYWSIARSRLGDAASGAAVFDYTQALIDANAGRLGYDDPAMLHPGDEIELVALEETDVTASSRVAPGGEDAESVPHVVVEPGDSYWSIAEESLGDDAATHEILEVTNDLVDLNSPLLGYDVRPMIHPGDTVFLQDPATFPPPAPAVSAAPGPEPAALREFIELVHSIDDAAPEPAVAAPDTTDVAATTSSTTSTMPPAVGDPDAADSATDAPSKAPLGVGEASLLATGIVALLAAKRRARLRAAEPPARLPRPRSESVATERMLRRLDDGERLMRVDIALRAVAAVAAATDHRVVAVRSAPEGTIEVSMSGPVSLAEPWRGSDRVWTLPHTVPVDDLATPARTVGAPCIALVPLGVDEEGWDVFVDLEAIGVLAIDADGATADGIVRAVAIGLACSEFAEVAHLVGVGLDPSVFLGHRQAQTVASLDEGIELAATLVGKPAGNVRTTFALRARQAGGEAWEPAVVLVASADAMSMASDVPASLSGRDGVALVAAAPVPGAAWRLRPAGSAWLLDPLGIRLAPVGIETVDLAAIVDAVDGDDLEFAPESIEGAAVAAILTPLVPHDVPTELAPGHTNGHHVNGHSNAGAVNATLHPPASPSSDETGSAFVDPPWVLMVRVLGSVDVVDSGGVAAKFDRSKTLELLAWMVTHRDHSTRVGARTALWDQDVRDATFANIVSEARRAMARHVEPPEGDEWLRRTLTDELSLHDLVVSDADIVEARYTAGRAESGAQALATLRPAVELLRELPFSGTSYLWPETEGLASSLVLLSTNVTAEYAKRALAVGDCEGVFWATGKGLKVLPGQEALIALRMKAHAEAGDLSGVRMEWESYERVINADPWSDGEPAPKLVMLRQQLLSK